MAARRRRRKVRAQKAIEKNESEIGNEDDEGEGGFLEDQDEDGYEEEDLRHPRRGTRARLAQPSAVAVWIKRGLLLVVIAALAGGAFIYLKLENRKPKAVISAESGEVRIKQGDSTATLSGGAGKKLSYLDEIQTGESGQASVKYDLEPSHFKVSANASMRILDHTDGKQFRLDAGQLVMSVTQQPEKMPTSIVTPHAMVIARNAGFTLNVAKESTRIEVSEGKVEYTHQKKKITLEVAPGQYALIKEGIEFAAWPIGTNLADGLSAFWKFEEGKNKDVKDSSGNKIDGELAGAKWAKKEGISGHALFFDGHEASVYVPHKIEGPDFTLSAWVKPDPDMGTDSEHGLFYSLAWGEKISGWYLCHGALDMGLMGGLLEDKRIIGEPSKDLKPAKLKYLKPVRSKNSAWTSERIPGDSWSHVCLVMNGSKDEGRLFLGGKQVGAFPLIEWRSGKAFLIGKAAYWVWHGLIDEVRYYTRILTKEEMDALAAGHGLGKEILE